MRRIQEDGIEFDSTLPCNSPTPPPDVAVPLHLKTFSRNGQSSERRFGVSRRKSSAHIAVRPRRMGHRFILKQHEKHRPVPVPKAQALELDVLKSIVYREGLGLRIKALVELLEQECCDDRKLERNIRDLDQQLDELRKVNVKLLVRNVLKWRAVLDKREKARSGTTTSYQPFLWKGENYLLRMTQDLVEIVPTTPVQVLLNDEREFNPMFLSQPFSNQDTDTTTFLTRVVTEKKQNQKRMRTMRNALASRKQEQEAQLIEYNEIEALLLEERRLREKAVEDSRFEKTRYNELDPKTNDA